MIKIYLHQSIKLSKNHQSAISKIWVSIDYRVAIILSFFNFLLCLEFDSTIIQNTWGN